MAPTWAITGRSAHKAEEMNYRQKQDTFVDLPVKDVKEIAATEFEATLVNPKEEIIWGEGETPGMTKDRTVLAVETYHLRIAPDVQPILVEESIELELPWGTTLLGQMDVVDQHTNIRDTKHVSYKPRTGDDVYGTQPGIYGWAYQKMTGEIPKFTYDYVVMGRKDARRPIPEIDQVPTPMSQERIDRALERVRATETLIRTGAAPANPSAFNCGGCGYRAICPYAYKR